MAASGEVQSQLEQGFEVGGALRCSITSCCHWQGHPVLVQQLLAHEAILSPPFLWNVRKFFDDCSDGLLQYINSGSSNFLLTAARGFTLRNGYDAPGPNSHHLRTGLCGVNIGAEERVVAFLMIRPQQMLQIKG